MGNTQGCEAAGGGAGGRVRAPIYHHRQLDARVVQFQRQIQSFVVRDHYGSPGPGPNPVQIQELPNAGAEHDARQVVAGEQEGVLIAARRGHQLVVPEMDETVFPDDAQEPSFVGAEGQ